MTPSARTSQGKLEFLEVNYEKEIFVDNFNSKRKLRFTVSICPYSPSSAPRQEFRCHHNAQSPAAAPARRPGGSDTGPAP